MSAVGDVPVLLAASKPSKSAPARGTGTGAGAANGSASSPPTARSPDRIPPSPPLGSRTDRLPGLVECAARPGGAGSRNGSAFGKGVEEAGAKAGGASAGNGRNDGSDAAGAKLGGAAAVAAAAGCTGAAGLNVGPAGTGGRPGDAGPDAGGDEPHPSIPIPLPSRFERTPGSEQSPSTPPAPFPVFLTLTPSQSACRSVDARDTSFPRPASTPASRPVASVLAAAAMLPTVTSNPAGASMPSAGGIVGGARLASASRHASRTADPSASLRRTSSSMDA